MAGAYVFLMPRHIAVLSCGIALWLAPVTPSFRVISSKRHRVWLRAGAVVIGIGWIVIAEVLCKNGTLANGIFITVVCANCQLVIPKTMLLSKQFFEKEVK